jgi:class 3 adenylate cyclase
MRLSIGVKIFSIAVFLAIVMIAAALLSESRVRQAEIRIDVLADHLLPLLENSNELRTTALREKMEFDLIVSSEASGEAAEAQRVEKLYEDHFQRFSAVARAMHDEIDAAIDKLPTADRKLTLANLRVHVEAIVSEHEQLHRLIKRIIARHTEGNEAAKTELIGLYRQQDESFIDADRTLAGEIRAVVDAVALTAKKDEAEAISFEHIVTAIAAILGLLLASIMTRALLSPIRNLRLASVAIKEGDLSKHVEISGNDELADLSDTFNEMIDQLRQKEKTEAVFGRYVDPRVIDRLVDETGENANDLAAAGRQEASIFFSDIAGYTSVSERLTPSGLVHLMNEYFNMAGEPITETGGLIDKFIGDAVMAFWCPPFVPAEDIGKLACKAAIGEAAMIRAFQERLPEITGIRVGAPKIDIRMGIATGEVIVGSIGSTNKRNFTVIGDMVNLSSRLEGANKFYGTQTLICQRTHELIGDGFITREIDNLAVKGKNEAIRVFELFADGQPTSDIADAFGHFAEALDHYRHGNWTESEKNFKACLDAKPDDAPSRVFLSRIERLKAQPPGADWDGVWHLDAK